MNMKWPEATVVIVVTLALLTLLIYATLPDDVLSRAGEVR
jgi:hypothetical protein